MTALQGTIVAMSNERDAAGLHVALGDGVSQLRPVISRLQAATDSATSQLSTCLRDLRGVFTADEGELDAAVGKLAAQAAVVVDCRRTLGHNFTAPYGQFYATLDSAVRIVADLELTLLRVGYSGPNGGAQTAGTSRITAQFAGMSMLTSLRLTYGALRGIASMAIAAGRFESVVMARDFITAASMSRDYEARWGSILASSGSGDVSPFATVTQLTAVIVVQVDALRTELETYALQHAGSFLAGTITPSTRYLDGSLTLHGPLLFGGRSPPALAWYVHNVSVTAHRIVLDPIQSMLSGNVEGDVARLRRDAVIAVVYAVCTVFGTLVVTAIVGFLLERGRHMEAAALAERLMAESSDALAGMVAHETRGPLWCVSR
jgi:hypothetical protein